MTLDYETTKAIEQQLRILGYSRGTVEWDGALAAARVYASTEPRHDNSSPCCARSTRQSDVERPC